MLLSNEESERIDEARRKTSSDSSPLLNIA